MKKITYSVAFAMAVLCSSTAVAQQGFGTNRPDRSAAVEIRSSNKGLLIPRVKLTGLEDTSTISNPANSLLVFNDGTAISQGYYYWKADSSTANTPGKWIPFVDQSNLNFTLTSFENTMVLGLPNGDSKTADIISSIEITYPSFDTTVSNSKRIARFSVNKKDADLKYEEFFAHGLHVTNGLNGAIATSGDEVGKFVVKLGGNLTEPTTIHTQGNAVKIQGLVNQGTTPLVDLVSDSSVTALNNNVVAVGNIVDGTLKVATPKDVVTAGIQNDLTVDGTNLTSTVNSDSSTVDLTDVIRLGQETVKLISSDTSVAITSSVDTSTTNKIVTYDLKVAGVNDAIEVGNGLSKDATSRVVLGGTLDTNTTIITQGNKVHVQGLSQVTDMADQVVAVGHYQTGEIKVATPKQIVAAGIQAENGLYLDSSTTNMVRLGGKLTENTVITTGDSSTLAIAGLTPASGANQTFLVLGSDNVLKTATLGALNSIVTKTSNYPATLADETILVNATTASVTITLPNADSSTLGKRYVIKSIGNSEVNSVIISSNSIDGLETPIESTLLYQSWTLQSDGKTWWVVGL